MTRRQVAQLARSRQQKARTLHRWLAQSPSAMNFGNVTEADTRRPMAHAKRVSQLLGAETATWERFAELREQWQGKLIVKGIMTPEDAVLAADHGADAIVVSNHGGRQLDGLPATIEALPAIAAAAAIAGETRWVRPL